MIAWVRRNPKRAFAWVLLIVSLVNWPLSMFTYAKDEPPIVLSLSWLAIILTEVDALWIAKQDEGG